MGYAVQNFFRIFPEICPECLGCWGGMKDAETTMRFKSNIYAKIQAFLGG